MGICPAVRCTTSQLQQNSAHVTPEVKSLQHVSWHTFRCSSSDLCNLHVTTPQTDDSPANLLLSSETRIAYNSSVTPTSSLPPDVHFTCFPTPHTTYYPTTNTRRTGESCIWFKIMRITPGVECKFHMCQDYTLERERVAHPSCNQKLDPSRATSLQTGAAGLPSRT